MATTLAYKGTETKTALLKRMAEHRARVALDRAIANAYGKGIGSAELGRELGITAPSVHKRLDKMGVKS